jgi:uncharacterized protein YprB with RNaseH-like and TPR domain
MRYRVLDIETIAHPDAGQWLEPVEPDARLKDPVKREESIREKTAARDEKLALDPDCCRIVALGYVDVGSNDPTVYVMKDEAEERAQLTAFWASYRQHETKLVTFYGHSFDVPVMMRRSLYLGVKYPPINLDRFRTPHLDVHHILTERGALKSAHSLKFYQKRLGLPTLDKVDGADIAKLVAAGDWQAVHDHCLSDVGLTHALANKLGLIELSTKAVAA